MLMFHSSGILYRRDCIQHPDIQLVLVICFFFNAKMYSGTSCFLILYTVYNCFHWTPCIKPYFLLGLQLFPLDTLYPGLYCIRYTTVSIGHPVPRTILYTVYNCIHWTPCTQDYIVYGILYSCIDCFICAHKPKIIQFLRRKERK